MSAVLLKGNCTATITIAASAMDTKNRLCITKGSTPQISMIRRVSGACERMCWCMMNSNSVKVWLLHHIERDNGPFRRKCSRSECFLHLSLASGRCSTWTIMAYSHPSPGHHIELQLISHFSVVGGKSGPLRETHYSKIFRNTS